MVDQTDSSICGITVTGLSAGTYYVVATAYNDLGIESEYSNQAVKVVAPAAPNPPANLTVSDIVAYSVLKIDNAFAVIGVGTVPAGTPCDPTQSVNGYYVVDWEAVEWSGTVRSKTIVADCS
jgi:hypothetical protein